MCLRHIWPLAAQHTSAIIKRLIAGTLAALALLLYCTKQLYCCIIYCMRELRLVPSWRTNLPCRALPKGAAWLCFESEVICKSICSCNDHALISQTLEHLLALVQPHILLGASSNAGGTAALPFPAPSSPQTPFGVPVSKSSRSISRWFPYEARSPAASTDDETNCCFVYTELKNSRSISFLQLEKNWQKSSTAGDQGDESRS